MSEKKPARTVTAKCAQCDWKDDSAKADENAVIHIFETGHNMDIKYDYDYDKEATTDAKV